MIQAVRIHEIGPVITSENIPRQFRIFRPDIAGEFIHRPNRFIVQAETAKGLITAHCPNPGRLQEILLPGAKLLFEHRGPDHSRKTDYTLVAADHDGCIVPLHAQRINKVAETLILPRLFGRGVKIRSEVTLPVSDESGRVRSRIDFSVASDGDQIGIEAKSCTLCEHGVAMFPDAPTIRGTRHIRELAHMAQKGDTFSKTLALFVIGRSGAKVFMPNIHTDPEFSLATQEASKLTTLRAVEIHTSPEGYAEIENLDVPIDLGPVELVGRDSGIYFLILRLNTAKTILTGAMGSVRYGEGYYVYVGSAKRGLSHRINRHCRKRKQVRWHIDYLTAHADSVIPFPIYTAFDLECRLAGRIKSIGPKQIPGFGCSDCRCTSHLFGFDRDPMKSKSFVEILFEYRHRVAFAGE